MEDRIAHMYFKVPGDIEIEVYPDAETIHDTIQAAIDDGATKIQVVLTVVRLETIQ